MTYKDIRPERASRKFMAKLKERGIEPGTCYQCGRCSSGCPVTEFFDLSVMQIVRLAAYGEEERILRSKTIWLCAACETCASRCPNDIEITALMDVSRELALRKGILPAEGNIPLFHSCFLDSIKRWGRAYELGLIAGYKLKSKDFFSDIKLGTSMFLKGKLTLRPHPVNDRDAIKKIFSGQGKEYGR